MNKSPSLPRLWRLIRIPSCLPLCLVCIALFNNTVAGGAMLLHIETTKPRVGQRGTTVEVTIQGMCLKTAKEIIFYKPGIRAVQIEPLPDLTHAVSTAHGGRIQEQIRCQFEIAPDCPPGEYPFRIRTATEISSLGTFHVSPFPVIDEEEKGANTNDTLATALPVALNTTIRGKMGQSSRGDIDLYKVPVLSGQRLSVEVDSVRIADIHYGGSEYDLAVRILDEEGKELVANDDNPLHLQDPVAAVKIRRDGFAFVEVRRSLFTPTDRDYVVHIGSNQRALVAYPPGAQAGTIQSFELLGDPLGSFTERLTVPDAPGTFEYFVDAPSAVLLRSSPYPNVLEDANAEVTSVEKLPAALNGRIDQRDDRDAFRVSVQKGERYRVRVFAAALGSPIDATIRVRPETEDAPNEKLEADDSQVTDRDIFGTSFRGRGGLKEILDPSIVWEPKRTGSYLIEVGDTSGSSGPTAIYRVEVEPLADSVHTLLNSTAFDWQECIRTSGLATAQGNRWTVNVSLPQGQGNSYRGELELVARGLPQGVSLVTRRIPAGRNAWPVQFIADASVAPGCSLITIAAQPVDPNAKLESRSYQCVPYINHSGGDAWRTVLLDRYVFAVTDPAPFSIHIETPPAALVRGGELAIPIKVLRRPEFQEPVDVQFDWVPPGVSVQPAITIPADATEALLRITAAASAPLGSCPLVVSANSSREDLDSYLGTGRVRVSSEMVDLTIAESFVELASQPESVRRGARQRYVWSVQHKSPFSGEASVRLLGLPKGVSTIAPDPALTQESKEVAFEIEATEEALLGSVRGISCEVTVKAAGQEIRQRTGNGTLRIDPTATR